MVKIYKKAILPLGFKASGIAAGIKKSGNLDLALFYSELPAKVSCKATTNKIQAAPIKINNLYLKTNKSFCAIIANSGNANAFCGAAGLRDSRAMTQAAARALSVKSESVLVASTGIIARRLPVIKIKKAIPDLAGSLSRDGIDKAVKAIMTTDKIAKKITASFSVGSKKITICGIAKGAGMIAPNMATMLSFIFTDANITQGSLNRALGIATENSFNCITVDGCMSTNDTVIMLANQAAGNSAIDKGKPFDLFLRALNIVCLSLAKLIIQDAEGATKFIRIKVEKARSFSEAKKIALGVANSNLFKTAMYASSSNVIGRIAASVGASGVNVKENDLKIGFSSLNKRNVDINISVGKGKFSAIIYTSDLTHEYVKINAEYN